MLAKNDINDIWALRADEHLPLLKHMKEKSNDIVLREREKYPDFQFQIGFHAIPSMNQLHLHIISRDFCSDFMKKKKHWNSFTTRFFIGLDHLIMILEECGCVKLDKTEYEQLLKTTLKCHYCHASFVDMPKLKAHILFCGTKINHT